MVTTPLLLRACDFADLGGLPVNVVGEYIQKLYVRVASDSPALLTDASGVGAAAVVVVF